jgi:hypothetical protein
MAKDEIRKPAARGPGRYDAECTAARTSADARAVLLIVVGGNRGHGFSVQCVDGDIEATLPRLLRDVADDIEAGVRRSGQ